MSELKFPLKVSIYVGEGRMLIVPVVRHVGGYSIDSEYFIKHDNMQNAEEIGISIYESIDFIKKSPICASTAKEQKENAAWKKNSKYKGWVSFWNNNYYISLHVQENGEYKLNLMEKMKEHKGVYNGSIKMIELSSQASEKEIGNAVIELINVAEQYY